MKEFLQICHLVVRNEERVSGAAAEALAPCGTPHIISQRTLTFAGTKIGKREGDLISFY